MDASTVPKKDEKFLVVCKVGCKGIRSMNARKRKKKLIGTVHSSDAGLRVEFVGNAFRFQDGEFELLLSQGTSSPLVRSKKTGRYFSLPWETIVQLAVARGINVPDPKLTGIVANPAREDTHF